MARGPLQIIVRDPNTGKPIRNALATIKVRGTTDSAPIYSAETGGTLVTVLQSDRFGTLSGWMEPGRYRITITATGYTLRPYDFDISDPDNEADGTSEFVGVIVDGHLEVELSSDWGIDEDGIGYYDTGGASPGEDAWPSIDEDGLLNLTRFASSGV